MILFAASSSTSQLALNALLKRCEEVLRKYADDERLSGNCPLPRSRMNEVSLVLKSVTVLISSLKEAQKTSTANSKFGDLGFSVAPADMEMIKGFSCRQLGTATYRANVSIGCSNRPQGCRDWRGWLEHPTEMSAR